MHREMRVAALMYHDVESAPGESGFQMPSALPYKTDRAVFQTHLGMIARAPARPATIFEALASPQERHVLLTFDDGGKSAVWIADLLEEQGWRGHFFITTAMIGEPGFVTSDDIRELHRRGHVVGSHSHTHPTVCYNIEDAEMAAEWETSCSILARILGEPVLTASIPGGDRNRGTVATAARAGIRYLFTSEPIWRPWQEAGVLCFGRVCLKNDTSAGAVERFARFRGFASRWAIRRCKQLVKRLMGPLYTSRSPRSLSLPGSTSPKAHPVADPPIENGGKHS